MLESGVPAPSYTIQAGCYNSRRDRIVFPMRGLMAVYDPATKRWSKHEATAIINGRELRGGPPVFGIGAGYDPVNDEIVVFPHYAGTAGPGVPFMNLPKNLDRLDVDGRISSHLGTLRFSYEDNTWRRVSDTFGSEGTRAARKALFEQLGKLSDTLDGAWAIRRRPTMKDAGRIAAALGSVAGALEESDGALRPVQADLAEAAGHVADAAAAAKNRDWTSTLAAGRDALRAIEAVIDGPLRVEPPPRCATPMVYDPKHQAIVMFGGYSGRVVPGRSNRPGELNDTWVYDVNTKQWRQIAADRRPPGQLMPSLFHDPASGRIVLLAFEPGNRRRKRPDRVSVWTLDVAKGAWSKRHEVKWAWGLPTRNTYAARVPRWTAGYEPRKRLLVVTLQGGKNVVMKLDLAALPAEPAPARTPLHEKPHTLPADKPEVVERLKTLPANQWVPLEPTGRAAHRGWSSIACDQVRGHVYSYGGGHSTYQINNVAILALGANTWTTAAGDHNDFIPAAGWGGCTMGYRGGQWAHHMRNQYVAIDGRMYVGSQQTDRIAKMSGLTGGQHLNWFYDVDRGGIWRQQVVPDANVTAGKDVKTFVDTVHVSDPSAGLLLGTFDAKSGGWGKSHVRIFDAYANTLRWRKVRGDVPRRGMEGTPFDLMRDRGQIFYLASRFNEKKPEQGGHQPYAYDVKTNTWQKLESKNTPAPARPLIVCYLDGQDAVWACLARKWGRQRKNYFYSLKTGAWTEIEGEAPGVAYPYGQVVYVRKFGVLVNVAATKVMRPDVSTLTGE
ncbi:MAG: Kelch repeat-containing protein [bacterium]